ncbi:MAG: histidinol-phosphate transaminase [Halanaerobiales bacterium]|jgi:histidinol-phosphate aminotransferase|nr:histidinol-phosphate transaminase [Bacillota bacterium]HOA40861.1 histidinol-phosphate transaminase [Halanaerobiales bacterium]HPZ62799.1 histidinol-phosphate transaminase [Halanaerobiales bacterium]HQD04782.1 histidinol-phosphate transaminase [Halanaerobiales bacterium]
MTSRYVNLMREEIGILKPYIPGKPIEEVQEEYGLERVVKLASNENPLPLSEKVRKAIENELREINRYPDSDSRLLKKALAGKLGLSEEMLLFGNGSDGLLKIIGETFLNKGDEVIVSDPTFVEYIFVANLMGAELKRIEMKSYQQDLAGIIGAITDKTKMIFLTSPHNPAGTIIKKGELRDFLDQVPENILVVVDEAYYEYVQDEDYPDIIEFIKEGYPVIGLRTFSKAYGLAGIRLGYLFADPEIVALLAKALDPFNVNRIAQAAALAALEDEEFLQKTIELNEEGKEFLYREMGKRGFDYVPTEANFILVNVRMDAMDLFNKLLRLGVIIRPGDPLGYPEHIRLTIGTMEENKIFLDSIDKVLG